MKRSSFILKYQKYNIQSIDHQTLFLELMLDELILFFNSLNGPFVQVLKKKKFILSDIQLIQLYQTKTNKNEKKIMW